MSCAVLAFLFNDRPLWYYIHVPGIRELPLKFVRPAFRFSGNCELPSEAHDLRGIFRGGLDPAIFVRFQTDDRGLEAVLEIFSGPAVVSQTFVPGSTDMPPTRYGGMFPQPALWEEKIGVHLFDQESTKSGRVLELVPDLAKPDGYKVFIDDDSGMVYIYAYHI